MWLDRTAIAYCLLVIACVWIFWIDVRPFVMGWWKKRPSIKSASRSKLVELGDEAKTVAVGINELIGETANRPPTNPRFKGNADLWQQENHERQESALRQFHSKYATDAFRIIDTAKKYDLVDKDEIWRVSHISYGYGLSEMAQLLSAISARTRETDT